MLSKEPGSRLVTQCHCCCQDAAELPAWVQHPLPYVQDDADAQPSSLALPSIDESGLDALAAEMAKLDRAIAGPVPERPPWMQRPTAADLAAAAAAQANSTPTHRSQHSRTSSFGANAILFSPVWVPTSLHWSDRCAVLSLCLHATDFASSVKELEGNGVVLHDFDGADEQELTVFAEQQARMSILQMLDNLSTLSIS